MTRPLRWLFEDVQIDLPRVLVIMFAIWSVTTTVEWIVGWFA